MSEDHALWEVIGNLHRTRSELIAQLAADDLEDGPWTCSFCLSAPPDVKLLRGPNVAICDRCVELCREVFARRERTEPG